MPDREGGIRRFRPREGYPPFDQLGQHAAVLSEVHPESPWDTRAALARNRLTAALSDVLLVVEMHESGGTLSTLRHAIGLGRRTFAVHYQSPTLAASGNHVAEELGAQPVRTLRQLRLLLKSGPARSTQPPLPWR